MMRKIDCWLWVVGYGLACLHVHGVATTAPRPSPAAGTSLPFLNFRQSTLDYHGPSADFTNLTQLRIGWFGPTNLDDPLAGDLWWAANFAVEEANAATRARITDHRLSAADLHHALPFRLIPCWSADPWGNGVTRLARMVYDEEPLALLGSVDSAATHLAEQIVAKANLPLVSPITTDHSVTLAGVSWMFACAPGGDAIARLLADSVLLELNQPAARLALLTVTDHSSRMTAREVLRELSRRGRLPDFRFDFSPGAAESTRQRNALATARPTVVLILAEPEDAARLVRVVRTCVADVEIFGGPTMGRTRFLQQAGSAAEGVRLPLLCAPANAEIRVTRFAGKFAAERGREPDYAAMLTYDTTRLLVEAIQQAGPNRARIREALSGLSPWQGLGGAIEFDGTGHNTRTNLALGIVRDGRIVWHDHGRPRSAGAICHGAAFAASQIASDRAPTVPCDHLIKRPQSPVHSGDQACLQAQGTPPKPAGTPTAIPGAMTVAVPVWQERVSPVFDAAARLLVVRQQDGRELDRKEIALDALSSEVLARSVVELHVDVLLCAAISEPLRRALERGGVRVESHLCGQVDAILRAFSSGNCRRTEFRMPGCWDRHERQAPPGFAGTPGRSPSRRQRPRP